MGGSVNGGLYGDHPRLDKLEDGGMIHSMDYRALYDRITTQWWADTQRPWVAFEDARLQSILKAWSLPTQIKAPEYRALISFSLVAGCRQAFSGFVEVHRVTGQIVTNDGFKPDLCGIQFI